MNQVNLIGKVVSKVDVSQSNNGTKVGRIKLAVEKFNKDAETDNDEFEIVVFRDLADIKLNVGQYVGVSGKLSSNNYAKDDKKYYNCSIIGNNITLL